MSLQGISFTSGTGTYNVPVGTINFDYYIVAGGGGGGNGGFYYSGGGGGFGGYVTGNFTVLGTGTNVSYSVGLGGGPNSPGESSYIIYGVSGATAYGGGAGNLSCGGGAGGNLTPGGNAGSNTVGGNGGQLIPGGTGGYTNIRTPSGGGGGSALQQGGPDGGGGGLGGNGGPGKTGPIGNSSPFNGLTGSGGYSGGSDGGGGGGGGVASNSNIQGNNGSPGSSSFGGFGGIGYGAGGGGGGYGSPGQSTFQGIGGKGASGVIYLVFNIPCFRRGTKILCLVDGEEVYQRIEELTKGTLVKTLTSGYKKLEMIGHSQMYNAGYRTKNNLYKLTNEEYPEIIEDLYLTGCHSILVDTIDFNKIQRGIHVKDGELTMNINEILGGYYITEGKIRLMTYLDDRAQVFDETGEFEIWHLSLEHEDYYMNYGIYANGLLVESCSKRFLKELSHMTLK